MKVPKMPPLPQCPDGENPFAFIARMAPIVRAQRSAVLHQMRLKAGHRMPNRFR